MEKYALSHNIQHSICRWRWINFILSCDYLKLQGIYFRLHNMYMWLDNICVTKPKTFKTKVITASKKYSNFRERNRIWDKHIYIHTYFCRVTEWINYLVWREMNWNGGFGDHQYHQWQCWASCLLILRKQKGEES